MARPTEKIRGDISYYERELNLCQQHGYSCGTVIEHLASLREDLKSAETSQTGNTNFDMLKNLSPKEFAEIMVESDYDQDEDRYTYYDVIRGIPYQDYSSAVDGLVDWLTRRCE